MNTGPASLCDRFNGRNKPRGAGPDIDKQAAQGVAQEIIDSGLESVQVHFSCGSAHSLFPLAAR
ncbi:MAG TPA: hypothetical protein VKG87_01000, partial [Terriglobales bacterium]|nr:hypothetical protein [Terriglobales bacterium]